jgi:hypothetical protein
MHHPCKRPILSTEWPTISSFDPENISRGQLLWQLNDPLLTFELDRNATEKKLIATQLAQTAASGTALAQNQILAARANLIAIRQKELRSIQTDMQISAPFDGVLTQDHMAVVDGMWIARGAPLTRISNFATRALVVYIPANLRSKIDPDHTARFIATHGEIKLDNLQLTSISNQVARQLEEAEFMQGFGGPIQGSATDKNSPKENWHRAYFAPVTDPMLPLLVISGSAVVVLKPESPATRIWRRVLHVLTTELAR